MKKELRGIDVYGGNRNPDGSETTPIVINWKQVKQSGIDFAILRVTELYGIDQQFKRNAKRCETRKIPYGVYRYSYALTTADAVKEAKDVVKALKGRKLDYPVFYDLEWNEQFNKLSTAQVEAIALAFFDVIVKAGYKVGIYCNLNWYRNKLSEKLKSYPLWISSYAANDTGEVVERLRPNYPNVIGWQYSENGTVPGINRPTDMNIFYEEIPEDDEDEDFVSGIAPEKVTAEDVLNVMRGWLGYSEAKDLYNSHTPLAIGYVLTYSDSWCDATVSAAFIKLGATDLIGGTECGVERHIQLFKAAGIWEEDGRITPKPGDIICFNWDEYSSNNNGFADHIGIVEYVDSVIHTIEGNASGEVKRRTYAIGDGNIRGYARPKYGAAKKIDIITPEKPAEKSYEGIVSGNTVLNKTPKCVGKIKSNSVPVKTWAGSKYDSIKSYPILNKGNLVDLCDGMDGYYYVRINNNIFGFVEAKYIEIV